MCVIAVCDKRKLTRSEVDKMWEANPDGAGLAWVESGNVLVRKGLMRKADFHSAYEHVEIQHVAHFRIATVGDKSAELTHPFEVSDESANRLRSTGKRAVLFHNGHENGMMEQLVNHCVSRGIRIPDGEWSDSRVIAMLSATLGKNYLLLLKSKFATVSTRGIRMVGDFRREDGVLVSNLFWKNTMPLLDLKRLEGEDLCGYTQEELNKLSSREINEWIGRP